MKTFNLISGSLVTALLAAIIVLSVLQFLPVDLAGPEAGTLVAMAE